MTLNTSLKGNSMIEEIKNTPLKDHSQGGNICLLPFVHPGKKQRKIIYACIKLKDI